jgi:transposase InsO family protein
MKTVAEAIGVSRSNLAERRQERPQKRIGRPPLPDEELVAQIKAVIGELPTYGYRRVHAILKRQALAAGLKPPNHKRIYRAMKVHGLLLDRHAATLLAIRAASLATSVLNQERRPSKVRRATEWLKPSSARSNATTSASVRDRMPRP